MRYTSAVHSGSALLHARARAGLTQAQLADRAGTSQATLSAYETGAKEPSLATLGRLLAETGHQLSVVPTSQRVVDPSRTQLAWAGRTLEEVIALAEELPVRHEKDLRFPRLRSHAGA
jgi:transcriptional regulator with XRE-family HTH domain